MKGSNIWSCLPLPYVLWCRMFLTPSLYDLLDPRRRSLAVQARFLAFEEHFTAGAEEHFVDKEEERKHGND